jgi:hypothetical protein
MRLFRVEILLTVEGDPEEWNWWEMLDLEEGETMSMRVDELGIPYSLTDKGEQIARS